MPFVKSIWASGRSNGRCPVIASYSMTPTAYQSAGGAGGAPCACSGAMYAGVPASMPATVSPALGPRKAVTSPKSSTTTLPAWVTSTLDGLTSRCSFPAA